MPRRCTGIELGPGWHHPQNVRCGPHSVSVGRGTRPPLGRSLAVCAGKGGARVATLWCVGGWRPGLLRSGPCRGWSHCFSPSLSVEGAFGRRRWRGSRVLPTGLPRGLRARLRRSCRWMASICATLGWDGRSISTQGGTYTVPWAGCSSVARALARRRPRIGLGWQRDPLEGLREGCRACGGRRDLVSLFALASQLVGVQGGPVDGGCARDRGRVV